MVTGESRPERRFILVTGLSGAGKSVVLNTLEDLGFYCIDNLPADLLRQLLMRRDHDQANVPDLVAVGIDARNPAPGLANLPREFARLREDGVRMEVIFVEANDEVLTRRFSETRRRHPLSAADIALPDAIARERGLMAVLFEEADLCIDTSFTAVHELRDLVRQRIALRPAGSLSMQFVSFGYKHGTPRDADFIFDTRCLPNPHWDKDLRRFSGRDQPVIDFLRAQPDVVLMLQDCRDFLDRWVPRFEADNRSYLCVAFGCTGGHHRSVFMAEDLAGHFRATGKHVMLKHRDL